MKHFISSKQKKQKGDSNVWEVFLFTEIYSACLRIVKQENGRSCLVSWWCVGRYELNISCFEICNKWGLEFLPKTEAIQSRLKIKRKCVMQSMWWNVHLTTVHHKQSSHTDILSPYICVLMCQMCYITRAVLSVPFVARTGAVSFLRKRRSSEAAKQWRQTRRESGVALWSPPPPPPPLPRSSPDPYGRRITAQPQTGSWGHGGDWITGKNFRAEGAFST